MGTYQNVQDFLLIYQGKSSSEICDFIKSIYVDDQLIIQIIKVIEEDHASKICDSLCEVLFNILSSGRREGTIFCFQFIPALIWAYFSLISKKIRWSSNKVEVLLLYVYNEAVKKNAEMPYSHFCSVPTLSKPSIYHEPMFGFSSMVTEHTLNQHDKAESPTFLTGPTKFLQKITVGYRSLVIKSVLVRYNELLPFCKFHSLHSFCCMAIRISLCGFPSNFGENTILPRESIIKLHIYPKVIINGEVMKEIVSGLHFIAFNGFANISVAAMKVVHKKARYSLNYPAVLFADAAEDLTKLSSNKSIKCFEHVITINSNQFGYRPMTSESNWKGNFMPLYRSSPHITQGFHSYVIQPLGTSSSTGCTSIADIVDAANTENPASVFFELAEKVALIDENISFSKRSPVKDSDDLDKQYLTGNVFNEFEVIKTNTCTPKIIIDLSDLNAGRNPDKVPLIHKECDNSKDEVSHTLSSPLTSSEDNHVNHVYDTQL